MGYHDVGRRAIPCRSPVYSSATPSPSGTSSRRPPPPARVGVHTRLCACLQRCCVCDTSDACVRMEGRQKPGKNHEKYATHSAQELRRASCVQMQRGAGRPRVLLSASFSPGRKNGLAAHRLVASVHRKAAPQSGKDTRSSCNLPLSACTLLPTARTLRPTACTLSCLSRLPADGLAARRGCSQRGCCSWAAV